MQWCFSQVKGTLDEDLTEGKKFTRNPHPSIEGFLVTSEAWNSTNLTGFVHVFSDSFVLD